LLSFCVFLGCLLCRQGKNWIFPILQVVKKLKRCLRKEKSKKLLCFLVSLVGKKPL